MNLAFYFFLNKVFTHSVSKVPKTKFKRKLAPTVITAHIINSGNSGRKFVNRFLNKIPKIIIGKIIAVEVSRCFKNLTFSLHFLIISLKFKMHEIIPLKAVPAKSEYTPIRDGKKTAHNRETIAEIKK